MSHGRNIHLQRLVGIMQEIINILIQVIEPFIALGSFLDKSLTCPLAIFLYFHSIIVVKFWISGTFLSPRNQFIGDGVELVNSAVSLLLRFLGNPTGSFHEFSSIICTTPKNVFNCSEPLFQMTILFLELPSVSLNGIILESSNLLGCSFIRILVVSRSHRDIPSFAFRDCLLETHNFNLILISNPSNFFELLVLHDSMRLSKKVINQHCQLISWLSAGCNSSKFVNTSIYFGRD